MSNRPGGMFLVHCLALVIGDETNLLCAIEGAAKFEGDPSGLHQVQAEGGNHAAVGAWDFGTRLNPAGKQGGPGRIEHGVVGAVAGAIQVASIEQKRRGLRSACRLAISSAAFKGGCPRG